MVGGIGHSLMVSLGHSLNKNNEIVCLDGTGHCLCIWDHYEPLGCGNKNLKHIVFNNYCHGQLEVKELFRKILVCNWQKFRLQRYL